ncbi:ribosomal protein L7Ae/L30e/S12e/Gadd45 [Alkaliphilus metalliredigens QYMF]|uniref:Ribosomal protein L7Ae/L30e/S12e/Gadd45 n=1 Tax=Alkaliphilus metalliredigens (strain QYMF) TaxID=293826 RepID=A6TRK8_ALKMQ|nr:ribosomal L7Ae/L30e/S12e/Gadd45 family protein [Alkaliphilus metalliredigens]ABR48826.1 ribosomal protein L7Ae/L30e/S12e/Gadd45 [Alkaliphilus metalliredigens QYMF]
MEERTKNLLGLGMKSGSLISGEENCKKELKKGKVYLILLAKDSSDNTTKLFNDKCTYYQVPIRTVGTKEILGNCIGKSSRAVVGIKDKKFASRLMEYIDENSL